MNILVSACLLGVCCRYDGKDNMVDEILKLRKEHHLIPICPEVYGGLATPRDSAEICNGRVMTSTGGDVTEAFTKGAKEALRLATLFGCKVAILKEKSPSCGFGMIYDGTHSRKLIAGNGMTAQLLADHGITVYGETSDEWKKLYR